MPERRSACLRQAGVPARRRGNLKSSLAPLGTGLRFTRHDNFLNRDLGGTSHFAFAPFRVIILSEVFRLSRSEEKEEVGPTDIPLKGI